MDYCAAPGLSGHTGRWDTWGTAEWVGAYTILSSHLLFTHVRRYHTLPLIDPSSFMAPCSPFSRLAAGCTSGPSPSPTLLRPIADAWRSVAVQSGRGAPGSPGSSWAAGVRCYRVALTHYTEGPRYIKTNERQSEFGSLIIPSHRSRARPRDLRVFSRRKQYQDEHGLSHRESTRRRRVRRLVSACGFAVPPCPAHYYTALTSTLTLTDWTLRTNARRPHP